MKTSQMRKATAIYSELAIARESATVTYVLAYLRGEERGSFRLNKRDKALQVSPVGIGELWAG